MILDKSLLCLSVFPSDMLHRRSAVMTLLCTGIFSIFLSIFSIIPLLPLIATDLHISKVELGVATGVFMIFMAFLQIPAGVGSDKWGRRPLIVAGIFIFSLGLLLHSKAFSLPSLLLARSLSGTGSALFFPTAFAMIGDLYKREERGRGMGIASIFIGLGTAGGYALGGIGGSLLGWREVFFALFLLSVITSTGLLALQETSPRSKGSKMLFLNSLSLFKNPTVLFSSFIALLCGFSVLGASYILPFYAATHGISTMKVGVIFICYALLSSIGASIASTLSDRFGRKPLLFTVILTGAASMLTLSHLVEPGFAALLATFIFVSFGWSPVITLSTTILSDVVTGIDARVLGTSLGIYNMVRWGGAAVGPALSGYLFDAAGVQKTFLILSSLAFTAAALTLLLQETCKKRVI
jgi:predicted MFS family arabinose efflux permease